MADRGKVVEGLEYLITAYAFHGDEAECLGDALELLKEQETIVRCKNCKYWKNKYAEYDVHPWLPCMAINTSGNWYCANGERR